MKNVPSRLVLVMFALMVLFSCKKESIAPCSVAWAVELQNELTAIGTAAALYSGDQSDANCTALKAAYQNYIDALKPYGNCATLTGTSRTDWQNAINEAESDIDDIC